MPWATFDVNYPIGQDVVIKVSYHLLPGGDAAGYASFDYTLVSGAGWYGPIGAADFILRLPYTANSENARGGWIYSTEPFKPTYVADEAHWHITNLEPTTKNNLSFVAFYPKRWRAILKAQAETSAEPENFQGFLDLGDAYVDSAALYHGFDLRLLESALKAYNEALRLQPNSVKANLSVALMMWYLNYDDGPVCQENATLPAPILERLSVAVALDPQGISTRNTIEEILNCTKKDISSLPTLDAQSRLLVSMTPSPTLTPEPSQTPTIQPSATASQTATNANTLQATATLVPSATASQTEAPTVTATPTSPTQNSFDLSSLLIGVIIGAVVILGLLAIRQKMNT